MTDKIRNYSSKEDIEYLDVILAALCEDKPFDYKPLGYDIFGVHYVQLSDNTIMPVAPRLFGGYYKYINSHKFFKTLEEAVVTFDVSSHMPNYTKLAEQIEASGNNQLIIVQSVPNHSGVADWCIEDNVYIDDWRSLWAGILDFFSIRESTYHHDVVELWVETQQKLGKKHVTKEHIDSMKELSYAYYEGHPELKRKKDELLNVIFNFEVSSRKSFKTYSAKTINAPSGELYVGMSFPVDKREEDAVLPLPFSGEFNNTREVTAVLEYCVDEDVNSGLYLLINGAEPKRLLSLHNKSNTAKEEIGATSTDAGTITVGDYRALCELSDLDDVEDSDFYTLDFLEDEVWEAMDESEHQMVNFELPYGKGRIVELHTGYGDGVFDIFKLADNIYYIDFNIRQ